jgi:hypothetical protein
VSATPGEGHVPGPFSCPKDGRTYDHLKGLEVHCKTAHPSLSQRERSLLKDDARLVAGSALA